MSARVLREAAKKMRERATGLPESPWEVAPGPGVRDADGIKVANIALDVVPRVRTAIATHVAGMHPEVAKALADWLEHDAEAWEQHEKQGFVFPVARRDRSLAVATAYLKGGHA